jgi:hypothetical protein
MALGLIVFLAVVATPTALGVGVGDGWGEASGSGGVSGGAGMVLFPALAIVVLHNVRRHVSNRTGHAMPGRRGSR